MIEKYGKFTALDGTEFPYTDFAQPQGGGSQGRGARQADSRRAGKAKGPAVDDPRVIGAGRAQETQPSEPSAKPEKPPAETAGIKLPYPFSAPAKPLTPGEESAKKTFMEMHLAAARASKQRRASRQRTRHHRPDPSI